MRGWDTFAGESYFVSKHFTEAGARRAAALYLRTLNRTQPAETSGGQAPGGIQDRVTIARPDGSEYSFPE